VDADPATDPFDIIAGDFATVYQLSGDFTDGLLAAGATQNLGCLGLVQPEQIFSQMASVAGVHVFELSLDALRVGRVNQQLQSEE
jgi:hypothetical protein